MEQGKDIITIGPDGLCHAYQTKTGDIGLGEWRGMSGEVQELIELPVDYPGVDKSKQHRAYLVTNGSVTDPVRTQINDRNEDNVRKGRGYAPLEIIERDSLLKAFVDAQGRFVPRELPEIRTFLELYLEDGRAMLPKEKLFALLDNISFGARPSKKSDAIDAISSSLVIVSYLLNSFEASANHYAMAEGWSILAACIARYVTRYSIPREQWIDSVNLVRAELEANLALLRKEAADRSDFLEGDVRADGGVILQARTTIVLGALACHELLPVGTLKSDRSPDEVLQLILKHLGKQVVWGDSAFPYAFFLVKFLESRNQTTAAYTLLEDLFVALTDSNFRRSTLTFPSPYHTVEEILGASIPDRLHYEDLSVHRGSSYVLKSVTEMLVRRGCRELLSAHWRRLTYCEHHEFRPHQPEDFFAWRAEDGTNISGFPRQTESWASLVAEANDLSAVPRILEDFQYLLPFHILVCPHRATPEVIRLLDASPTVA
jgi:hypothetical protein